MRGSRIKVILIDYISIMCMLTSIMFIVTIRFNI